MKSSLKFAKIKSNSCNICVSEKKIKLIFGALKLTSKDLELNSIFCRTDSSKLGLISFCPGAQSLVFFRVKGTLQFPYTQIYRDIWNVL